MNLCSHSSQCHHKEHAAHAREEKLDKKQRELVTTATELEAHMAMSPRTDLMLDNEADRGRFCQFDWNGTINNYCFETGSDLDFTCTSDEEDAVSEVIGSPSLVATSFYKRH